MHVFQCLVMCRIVYLGIFTQCQYIPYTHANRRRILQRPIKIQWDTRSVYIFIQHFFFQFCAGLILAYMKENLTMVILFCESTYMYILQRVQTQARRPNCGTTLGQGIHSLHFSCPSIFSGPTLYTSGARPWSSLNANSNFPHYFINL